MRDLPGLSLGERVPRYFEALHKLSKAYIYPKRFLVQNGIAYIAGAEYGLLIFDLN